MKAFFLFMTSGVVGFAWLASQVPMVGISAKHAANINKSPRSPAALVANAQLARADAFPVGLYHVAWHLTPEQQAQDLKDIANAGFTWVHTSAANPQRRQEILQQTQALGLDVILEGDIPLDAAMQGQAESGVIANIADDVDNGKLSVDQLCQQRQRVQQIRPQALTYASGYTDQLGQFQECVDLIAKQVYPVYQGGAQEWSKVYGDLKQFSQTLAPGRQFYANLQTFQWPQGNGSFGSATRPPSAIELRNMTYQAVAAGAQGIFYYTYRDGSSEQGWYLPNHSDLWSETQTLNSELKALARTLQGRSPQILVETPQVVAARIAGPLETLIIVVNLTNDAHQSVQLPLSKGHLRDRFNQLAPSVPISSQGVELELDLAEVRIFRFESSDF
jgi:hypothetical protein